MKKPIVALSVIALLVAGALSGTTIGKIMPGISAGTASAAEYAIQPQKPEAPLAPAGNGFTYQGRLTNNGNPVTGSYDFQISLYNAAQIGSLLGTETLSGQQVQNGLFTLSLNFDPSAFNGQALWLQISVRSAGGGNYTTLTPRQELKPAPYAFYSQRAPWSGVSEKPYPFRSLAAPNFTNTMDTTGDVGSYSSATIGSDDLPIISYFDATNGDLKVLHCSNIHCTSATTSTIDSAGVVGQYSAIIVGSDGLPIISYYDATNSDLKVAHCSNLLCTSATTSTIDSSSDVGTHTSITVGADGRPFISYRHIAFQRLKLAHCSNLLCTSAITQFPISAARTNTGYYTSIAIGYQGWPVISYYNGDTHSLEMVLCWGELCDSAAPGVLDNTADVGMGSSIAIGSDGMGIVSYFDSTNGSVKVAHCENVACASITISTVDVETNGFTQTSIAIGADGLPIISYYQQGTTNLKVAHCNNPACTNTLINNVDTAGSVGQHSSITIGADGLPFISYYDSGNMDLKSAHCTNPFCINYQTRR